MDALSIALKFLQGAAGCLEAASPSLEDVENARDKAKAAAKLLGASFDLLSLGIRTVAPEQEEDAGDKFKDPQEYRLAIPEVDPPDLLGDFLSLTNREQEKTFGAALGILETKAGSMDDNPWLALWEEHRTRAMESVNFALHHRKPISSNVPTAMEVAAFKGGLN